MAFDVGTAVGYLDLDTSGFTKGFARARADMKTFSDENATFNDKLASTSSLLRNVGSSLTKWVTVPLVGAGVAITKVASDFESSMSKVAAISGAAGEDFISLIDKALEMGSKTKFSASEAAEAMQYMAMAGWKTEDMLNGIEGIMNLAAASGENLASVSDIVTDALTAFGLTAADAGRFADVLAAASANANTNVSMLGESFKYVAPVAGSLGYAAEDIAIALGLMANAGIKASQGGTSLRASLTSMIKPTEDAAAIMETYQLSLTNIDGTMKSFGEVMDMLRTNLGGLTASQQAQVAATLFGQEAMSGMLSIINASEEDYRKLTDAIYGSNGASQTMADTMQDNLGGQITILKSTIEGIAISFGDILLPMVKKVTSGLQGFATWLNSLSDEQKSFIANTLTWAAALGPVMLIIGKLIGGVSSAIKYFKTLGTALSVGKGIIAALGGSFGPILLVIAAVAAAVAGLKIAWESNFGGIQEKTAEMGDSLQRLFNNMLSLLQSSGRFFLDLWESDWMGVKTIFTNTWSAVETVFSLTLDTITQIFDLFVNIFAGDWEAAWGNVKTILSNELSGFITLFTTMLEGILTRLYNIGARLLSTAVTAFNNIKTGFTEVWDTIVEWLDTAKEDPVTAIQSIGTSMYDAGKKAITSLWDGLKGAWESVVKWVNDVVDWLVDKLSINSEVNINTNRDGDFASGLDYVPRDMIVKVHEGESIRTKQQTRRDDSASSGGNTYNFYSPVPLNEIEAAKQFKRTQRELAEGF